jgi:hypothetical protein
LVEHTTENRGVASSILALAIPLVERNPERRLSQSCRESGLRAHLAPTSRARSRGFSLRPRRSWHRPEKSWCRRFDFGPRHQCSGRNQSRRCPPPSVRVMVGSRARRRQRSVNCYCVMAAPPDALAKSATGGLAPEAVLRVCPFSFASIDATGGLRSSAARASSAGARSKASSDVIGECGCERGCPLVRAVAKLRQPQRAAVEGWGSGAAVADGVARSRRTDLAIARASNRIRRNCPLRSAR